jgi:hypothetical protein
MREDHSPRPRAISRRQFIKVERAAGRNPEAITHLAAPWLASGAELGLGTNDPAHIDLVEVTLT